MSPSRELYEKKCMQTNDLGDHFSRGWGDIFIPN